jgi:hypothetical protein
MTASRARSQRTRQRAEDAIRYLDAEGIAITFTTVAEAAFVSRSWLYRDRSLRTEIERLRTDRPSAAKPSAQRASADSMHRQREALLDEITRLKKENQGRSASSLHDRSR